MDVWSGVPIAVMDVWSGVPIAVMESPTRIDVLGLDYWLI